MRLRTKRNVLVASAVNGLRLRVGKHVISVKLIGFHLYANAKREPKVHKGNFDTGV